MLFALARPLLSRVTARARAGARTPRNDRGALLDPATWRMLQLSGPLVGAYGDDAKVEAHRREVQRNSVLAAPSRPGNVDASEQTIAGRPARLYTPAGLAAPSPLMLWFHGGGFVVGDLDSHDALCRCLASRSRCRVLAVDYRLAPEHKFPAAVEDAMAAWLELQAEPRRFGGDERLAVGGDSAGANLSAVVAWQCRDRDLPAPALQVLAYPATDMRRALPSHGLFADGFYLTSPMLDFFLGHYLPSEDCVLDPAASPLLLDDAAGLCPAIVVTAGFDPLRDEGEAYAQRLAEAGVHVTYRCEEALVHGYLSMSGLSPAAAAALDRLAADLKLRLYAQPTVT